MQLQWNLNNLVTNGAVFIGCNNEVAGIRLAALKQSHPFQHNWPHSRVHDDLQFCVISKLLGQLTQTGVLYNLIKVKLLNPGMEQNSIVMY